MNISFFQLNDTMEPFELSLRQVNFEEKDIKEEDNLDSFGNLVSYESDFKDKSQSLPVLAKKLIGYGKWIILGSNV